MDAQVAQAAPPAGDGATQGAQPELGAASAAVQAAGAGTPADGVQSQPGGEQVSLAELVKQHPHLKDQIEREYVSPHLKRQEQARDRLIAEAEARGLARAEQQRLQAQQSELVGKANAGDEDALKALGRLQIANVQSATQHQQLEQERQRLRYELASDMAKRVFGVDPSQIPPEVLQDDERFADYVVSNSTRVGARIESVKAELAKSNQDAAAIANAQAAADFGTRLQVTPSPHATGGGGGGPSLNGPMTQAEFERIRGNPDLVRANLARVKAGVAANLITG